MCEPRWLSDSEQRAWRAFIYGIRSLTEVLDRQLQADNNLLPQAYFEILRPLSEADGRSLRMSELADQTRSSRSRLSHAVARLEERGWVKRLVCPTDKRGQIAQLTDEGFAVVEEAAPGHVEAVRKYLIDQLTPEQIDVMRQIGEIMLETTCGSELPPRRG
jgi:DNA-binding MarR family transcriptional regulator